MVKVELLKELDNGIRFYSMENESLKIVVVNMGCRIMEIHTPDASGNKSDVILGLKNIEDYANDPAYFGAIIGRVANRIGDAHFTLNEKLTNCMPIMAKIIYTEEKKDSIKKSLTLLR